AAVVDGDVGVADGLADLGEGAGPRQIEVGARGAGQTAEDGRTEEETECAHAANLQLRRQVSTCSPNDSARRRAASTGTRAPRSWFPAGRRARPVLPANEALRRSHRSKRVPSSRQSANAASASSVSTNCASSGVQPVNAIFRRRRPMNEA